MRAYPCPVCQGRGCPNCRGSGALAVDEAGQEYYVSVDERGSLSVVGPKESSPDYSDGRSLVDRVFGWIEEHLAEPKDLWWVVKQLKARKRASN